MPVPENIIKLVETFDRNCEDYTSGRYNETQVRREFVDPLFIELGWDMNNTKGYAEAYKDVIHEDSIRIGGVMKAPDYCFRIGGTRKFFVEAKNPSINIKGDPNPAFQIRRYAWSSKLPLSILTDFEEFAVYDCRVRPLKNDKASKSRILYLKYTEYIERWDEIASVFSHDAILKGSFDKYAQSTKRKGTAEVDDAFLAEIESWRETLAKNIALRNPKLTVRQLNFAVQKTIDRIIFLRIAEDRGIEQYRNLTNQTNGIDVYQRLLKIFRLADDRYNSGLFHFMDEKDRPESPDALTPSLVIDDKPLRDIIRSLYPDDCPYEFSVLPIEILGNIYEQFLGKVITLTPGHRAKVEEKPEVKKAGGVYYTPSYIVDYIVKNTVGKLTENKTPTQVSKIKILDPACGSGSFLLGAYQYLLDWHLKYYSNNDSAKWLKGKSPRIAEIASVPPIKTTKSYKLTTAERKRILLNNIFGVDIDSQAVEVTKLSLLLKVLEGEKQLVLFHKERALPDLANNIKCGNSLIGLDFYHKQQLTMFDEEQQYKINAFDWKKEFPEILNKKTNPGFDAVIGNPPYIPMETMSSCNKDYFRNNFSQLERKFDSSIVFILAMLKKLTLHGRLGFISSLTWQTGENYTKLREYIFTHSGISKIVNLPFDVFKNAYVDTGVYVFSKDSCDEYLIHRFPKKTMSPDMNSISYTSVSTKLIDPPNYKVVLDPTAQGILSRSSSNSQFLSLGEFTISTQGLAPSRYTLNSKPDSKTDYPFLVKGQVYRYQIHLDEISYTDINEHSSLRKFYDKTPKILIRRVINRRDRLMATSFEDRFVFKKDINPFVMKNSEFDVHFVTGILNSKLISYLYVNTSAIATKDDFRQTTLAELRNLPIPILSNNSTDKARHDKMVSLVGSMLELNKKLPKANTPDEKNMLQRRIASTDDRIDQLVYELYDLTEEEIEIVKDSTK